MEPNNQKNVTATFNANNTVTFNSSGEIKFDNTAFGVVFFTLDVATGATQAFFPSNPIQWVDQNLRPIKPPDGARVIRDDDNNTRVRIAAAPSMDQTFRFYVIVQTTNGQFFGTDPTIVTMPPGV
jgi:hypothetical protein